MPTCHPTVNTPIDASAEATLARVLILLPLVLGPLRKLSGMTLLAESVNQLWTFCVGGRGSIEHRIARR